MVVMLLEFRLNFLKKSVVKKHGITTYKLKNVLSENGTVKEDYAKERWIFRKY